MARKKKQTMSDFFERGTEFFNSFNQTIGLAKELFNIFHNVNVDTKTNDKRNIPDSIEYEEKIKQSAYRFMKLKQGCGAKVVKDKFRTMVKEIRPDLEENKDKTDWFTALRVARETLLKYEK